jgi:hypothetical protein
MAGGSGSLASFVASQIVLLGALPFLLLPWVIARTRFLCADAQGQVCYLFFVLPIAFFLIQAARGPLEANWALVAYPTFWPLAQRLLQQSSFKNLGRGFVAVSFLVPLLASAALVIYVLFSPQWLSPERDRLAAMREHYRISREAAAVVRQHPGLPLFATTYQWVSYFRFQKVDAQQVSGVGRPSEFTLEPTDPCAQPAVLGWEKEGSQPLACFADRQVIQTFAIRIHEHRTEGYQLVRYAR